MEAGRPTQAIRRAPALDAEYVNVLETHIRELKESLEWALDIEKLYADLIAEKLPTYWRGVDKPLLELRRFKARALLRAQPSTHRGRGFD